MATTQRSTVVGVFEDRRQADQAVRELRQAGFRDNQIGYVTHREEHAGTAKAAGTEETHTGEGAAAGAITGGILGGLAGAIAAGLIPGVGPFIAAGILATTVGGAVAGAAAGGLVGALIGLGIPEEEARYYDNEFKSGRTLVTVRADGRYDEAVAIIRRHGGYDRATASGTAAHTAAAGQTMKLHEEELHAHKQPEKVGEARVRKEVATEHKTIDVPVQREEVVVERHPVSGQVASSADIRPGQEIRVPVTEEQVKVEKQPVVKEEVHVGKRQMQDTKQVGGTIRKEEVQVERQGNVDVKGNAGTTTPRDQGSRPK